MINKGRSKFILAVLIISFVLNFNNLILGAEIVKDNQAANVINLGYIAQDGEWIYYSNIADGSKLYKSKLDGSGEVKISNDVPNFINVSGDFIYYSNISNGYQLFKIKKDGTEKKRLIDESCFWPQVQGEWIYFAKKESSGQKIYKIDLEGKQKTRISKDRIYGFAVSGDNIYYSNEADGHKIYKVDTNGGEPQKINEDQAYYINVVGNNIYYQNANDKAKIYKVDIDGKNRLKLNDDSADYINVSGDWIFYSNASDNNKLYKMKTDGSSKTLINNEGSAALNIINDSVYFWKMKKDSSGNTTIDSSNLVRVNKDGSDKKVVKVEVIKKEETESGKISTSSMIIILVFVLITFSLEVWKLVSLRKLRKISETQGSDINEDFAAYYIKFLSTARIPRRSEYFRRAKSIFEKIYISSNVSQELKDEVKAAMIRKGINLNS